MPKFLGSPLDVPGAATGTQAARKSYVDAGDAALGARVATLETSGGSGGGDGGALTPVQVSSMAVGSYTASPGEYVYVAATSRDVTVTLPDAAAVGSVITVKKVDVTSTYTVHVTITHSEGAAPKQLDQPGAAVTFLQTGIDGWQAINVAGGLRWRGTWASASTYYWGDAVLHNGRSWVLEAVSSTDAPATAPWRGLTSDLGVLTPVFIESPAVGYTAAPGEFVYCLPTSNNITVAIPQTAPAGSVITVKYSYATAGYRVLLNLMNGEAAAPRVLDQPGQAVTYYKTGIAQHGWLVLSEAGGLRWCGTWVAARDYCWGDTVIHDSTLWVLETLTSRDTPAGGSVWRALAGLTGPQGAAGAAGATGPTGPKGDQGDPATNLVSSVAGRQGAVTLTSTDVGLANVNNTADSAKPVSTAQQTAIDAASTADRARANHTGTQPAATISDFDTAADARIIAQKGAASGLAPLDSTSKIASNYLPAIAVTSTFTVASQAAQLALTAQEGDVAIRTDLSQTYIHNGGTAGTMADWTLLATPTDAVSSVAGRTGVITLSKTDVGLVNVDNTADADKPVSTLQAAADALKVGKGGDTMTGLLALPAGAAGVGGLTIGGDVNLYRSAADILKTDDSFIVGGTNLTVTNGAFNLVRNAASGSYASQITNSDVTGYGQKLWVGGVNDAGLSVALTGDPYNAGRLAIMGDGKHLWSDGTASADTNLYRAAADTLKTDDALIGATSLQGGQVDVTRSFHLLFLAGAANEKVDFYFGGALGNISGAIEVTLTGLTNAAQNNGVTRIVYTGSWQSTGTPLYSTMSTTLMSGSLVNQFALMPLVWDAANSRYKLTIGHLTALANEVGVSIRFVAAAAVYADRFRTSSGITAVYTTDATVPAANTPPADASTKVSKSGDTMTGLLALPAGAAGVGGLTIGGDVDLYRSSAGFLGVPSLGASGVLRATGTITASYGAASSILLNGSFVQASGSTPHCLFLRAGTGNMFVGVNNTANDGTGGLQAFSGGATPALRAIIGSDLQGAALKLLPAAGALGLFIVKATESGNRFTIADTGVLSWGDGTAAVDTTLYRQQPGILNTPGSFVVGGSAHAIGGVIAASGAATSISLSGQYVRAIGTTPHALALRSGAGVNSVVVNNVAGDGTGGLQVWSGGATPALASSLTGTGQIVLPITGTAGGLLMGGDVNLYRSAASTLKTDQSMVVGTNLAVTGTTAFTGIPSGPTATPGTSTTQLATTGFVTDATATVSAADRARANHTGTQLAATVSDFSAAADARITAQKGAASGLAPLDASSKIASSYLPTFSKSDVGLANVDDTADTAKPVSVAQAAANALRVAKTGDTMTGPLILNADFAVSGTTTFTGTASAATAAAGTNTTQLATTAFVTAAVTASSGGGGGGSADSTMMLMGAY